MSFPLLINDVESENDFEETLDEDCFHEENSNGINQNNRQYLNPYLIQWLESKQKNEKFRFKGYVEYYKDANVSKCLIKSCNRFLSCHNAGNIKRHYRRIHNFVILHGKINPFPEGEDDSSNLEKYFSYDPVANKSFCKVPGCTKTFEGKHPNNMQHFRLGHNYKSDQNEWVNLCRLKFDRSQLPLNELIKYDEQTCTYRCLFLNCDHALEKNFFAIEKHYYDMHVIIFSKYAGNARTVYQFSNENIETSDVPSTDAVKLKSFPNEFLNDGEPSSIASKSKQSTTAKTLKRVQKKRRKFFASNYVEYCKKTNFSKCLIQNCGKRLKGLSPYNIQRHYQLLHNMFALSFLRNFSHFDAKNYALQSNISNFVSYNVDVASYQCLFVNCNDNLEKDINIVKNHYYEKHEIIISKKLRKTLQYKWQKVEDEQEPHSSKSLVKGTKTSYKILNSPRSNETFVATDYVSLDNNKCLMKNCPAPNEVLEERETIKSHYWRLHNISIGPNLPMEECELSNEYGEEEPLETQDLEYSDKEDSSFHDKHVSIIGKGSDSSVRIRKHKLRCESASTESDSFLVTNEILSEDEDEKPLQLCNIKNDYWNETIELPVKRINNKINDDSSAMALTKQGFLKSCFGLVIQRDLPLYLFDDDVFFKHLLSPYEKIINFNINSKLLLDIILKANDTIIEILRATFCNKILCLELFVVGHEKKYFLTVNARFVHEQSICNYLIGYMPLNEAGAEILPISEYLIRFNIDKQQVYMTTILADVVDDEEEIIEILNNICQYNSNIKKHPLCQIKILYRSFVQKYSVKIQNWQKLLNNSSKTNTNIFKHLNDLRQQFENSTEMNINIKPELINEANSFFKTIKIFENFMEKLNEEHYVAGDLYRDLLCCELELKGEHKTNNNIYASKLNDDLMACKNVLMQSVEFMAALYLDPRFNFLGSRLLTDEQKTSGKLLLCSLWKRLGKYLRSPNIETDPLGQNEEDDDKYALLNQHINDMMSVKSNAIIEDLITNCVATKREPFNLDILKYWHSKRQDMDDINDLTKIAFIFPSSQYMFIYSKENFSISCNNIDKIDKFLMKHNQNIIDKNLDLLF